MKPAAFGVFETPEPLRPLGKEGTRAWERVWALRRRWIDTDLDIEHVQLLCEAMDERVALRVKVLQSSDWRDRVALRALDAQVNDMLGRLGLTPADRERVSTGGPAEGGKLAALRAAR